MIKQKIISLGICSFLGGCNLIEHRAYHDTALKLQKEDYENLTKPPILKKGIPSFRPALSSCLKTPSLSPAMRRYVSLTLRESISLKEALIELGRQVEVDMALSPRMDKSGIIYSAYHRPFIDVIKDICFMTGTRFQIQGNRILIEPDDPYLETYCVQFLSHSRKSENRISVSTDVFSPLENQGKTDNGSDSVLLGKSHVDFWTELEQNLKMILTSETTFVSKGPPPYTAHRQGGLVLVFGTARQHHLIGNYLNPSCA